MQTVDRSHIPEPVCSAPPCTGAAVLLRSSWQTVNIGDIAHTFGALRALADHAPSALLTLWPCEVDRGVRERLLGEFPGLTIVEGGIDADGRPNTPELEAAFDNCDLMIHGSAPAPVAGRDCKAWHELTGKPYGFFGVTFDPWCLGAAPTWEGATLAKTRKAIETLPPRHMPEPLHELLRKAAFIFCRDTLSVRYLEGQELGKVPLAFGPDATFAHRGKDEHLATRWLGEHGLQTDGFLCVVPRLRWTPCHDEDRLPVSELEILRKAINRRTVETDHEILRQLLARWVRETGRKAIIVPEMTYQIPLGKEQLLERLPADVRPMVVWRDRFWLCDEAAATYARAAAVVSIENHSPILANGQATPAFYLRQPTDSIKGQMWHDVGLSKFTFEIDDAQIEPLWAMVQKAAERDAETIQLCENARDFSAGILRAMVEETLKAAGSTPAKLLPSLKNSVERVRDNLSFFWP
jgi:hypothetical protein